MIDRILSAAVGALLSLMVAACALIMGIVTVALLDRAGVPWQLTAAVVCAVTVVGAVLGYLGECDD